MNAQKLNELYPNVVLNDESDNSSASTELQKLAINNQLADPSGNGKGLNYNAQSIIQFLEPAQLQKYYDIDVKIYGGSSCWWCYGVQAFNLDTQNNQGKLGENSQSGENKQNNDASNSQDENDGQNRQNTGEKAIKPQKVFSK